MDQEILDDMERVQSYMTQLVAMRGDWGADPKALLTMAISLASTAKINSTLLEMNNTLRGVEYRLIKLNDIAERLPKTTDESRVATNSDV